MATSVSFIRVLLLLLFASAFLLFASLSVSGQGEEQDVTEVGEDIISNAGDSGVGLVGNDIEDMFEADLQPAEGVETVVYFPKNPEKSIHAGQLSEILVGVANNGEYPLKVHFIRASLHLPYDYRLHVQNFSALEFSNSVVPPSVQASFPYSFTVSKYLQPGGFSLVASILYEANDLLYRSVVYNGTVEVAEAGAFFSGETVFLITLALGLLGLFGVWIYGQFQRISKKTRRTQKVETGTKNTEAANNEWLQGTAYVQKLRRSISQSSKSKKKK